MPTREARRGGHGEGGVTLLPAVLRFYDRFHRGGPEGRRTFLLTAAAIGALCGPLPCPCVVQPASTAARPTAASAIFPVNADMPFLHAFPRRVAIRFRAVIDSIDSTSPARNSSERGWNRPSHSC